MMILTWDTAPATVATSELPGRERIVAPTARPSRARRDPHSEARGVACLLQGHHRPRGDHEPRAVGLPARLGRVAPPQPPADGGRSARPRSHRVAHLEP